MTKSALVLRDMDILKDMAQDSLVSVYLSVTTLDVKLSRTMEPRAASPQRRLDTIRKLSDAGIRCGVLYAPCIPGLNDHEMENILTAAHHAGACDAGYILLRLPSEVKHVFENWLHATFPR